MVLALTWDAGMVLALTRGGDGVNANAGGGVALTHGWERTQ